MFWNDGNGDTSLSLLRRLSNKYCGTGQHFTKSTTGNDDGKNKERG